jgi:hypothetical protein
MSKQSIPGLDPDISSIVFDYISHCSPITKLVCKNWNLQSRISPDEAITKSVKRGDVVSLEWLLKNIKTEINIFGFAVQFGQVRVLKWLQDTEKYQNHINKIELLFLKTWNDRSCTVAAARGHLEVIKWLRANGCEWDKWTCAGAASNGHLRMVVSGTSGLVYMPLRKDTWRFSYGQ